MSRAELHAPAGQRTSSTQPSVSLKAAASSGDHRQFKLPPGVHVQAVKQTLIQTDLPPSITLKREIPVPTMLLWTETAAPPMMKRFVAPPMRKEVARVTQSLPAAPSLSLPNRELNPAELNIASILSTETPHLVHPPAVASPVARTGQEPAKQIPQVGVADSAQPNAVNLISLPAKPLRSSGMLVLPPANQIAPSDAGLAGSLRPHDGASGTGEQSGGLEGQGGLASAGSAGERAGNGTGTSGAAVAGAGTGGSAGVAEGGGTDVAGGGNGANSAREGVWSATGSPIGNVLPRVTRIDLPKDGTFGVVVLGSASSSRYPETVGALSGKLVYTVYLKVGLRKSWILQYCLKTDTNQNSANGHSPTPIQAPWPFLIMRPDSGGTADPDYIIVHGSVTNSGKFDQLAVVFPNEFEKEQLLMSSLKLWAFRPASRDGVPVPVEVLLIIPREE